jgi:long-chain fatty acid transport protein
MSIGRMTERTCSMRTHAATAGLALTFALCLAPLSLPLHADDFAFHEVGARAAALGGAFTGRADDITAIFYNPAGLAFLKGLRLKTNLTIAERTISAYLPEFDVTFRSSPREYLQNIFLAWQPVRGIGLGLGYFSPYNFDSIWTNRFWTGDEVSLAAKLRSHYFRSVLSIEVLKGLAVSAALDIVSMSVKWDHKIPFELGNYTLPSETKVNSRHELSGNGLGFTASALWKVFPALQVGARYQKSVAVGLAGGNAFGISQSYAGDMVPDPYWPVRSVVSLLEMFYIPQKVTGKLTLPRELACGVALTPVPRLSLYLDVQWDKWSEFGRWEFRSVNTDENLSPGFTSDYQEFWGVSPNYGTQGAALALQDSRKFKAGLEFRLGRWFALRAGFARNESSVEAADRSPLYPDLDRNVYSFGGGYEGPMFSSFDEDKAIGQLSLDLFIRYSSADEFPSTLPGLEMTYGAKRWNAGVGVGFIF